MAMNIWGVLGISATKNKDELKTAYREKLSTVNPEDNPEGFKELRMAYEEALKLADVSDDKKGKDEDDPLRMAIDALYSDFFARIQVDNWRELLDRDEFVSLDSSDKAFVTLMTYLMDNFCLPKNVWAYLVEAFDIKGRKKELIEEYPEDFIEYMINNATYDDIINYYLFEGETEEIDIFLDKYYKLDSDIRRHDIESQAKLIEEMEQLDVYHPYLELCVVKHKLQMMYDTSYEELEKENVSLYSLHKAEIDELREKLAVLSADFPEEAVILMAYGDIIMAAEDYAGAKECYDRAAGLVQDKYIVNGKLADVAYHLGDFEKSRDMYMDLLKINHYDNSVRAGMIRSNLSLIEKYKKNIEENPEDNSSRMEMAWSYYQSYKFDDAIDMLDSFVPADEKRCEYFNVKGRTYLCLLRYDEALKCFYEWKNEIEKIGKDDNSEDALAKKKRFEYVNFLIADCLIKTKKWEEARKYLEIALAKEHEEIMLSYEAKCELEYNEGNYEACIDACEDLINRDDRNYIAYSFMAKSSYKLDYTKETMNACEHAIAIYPYVAEPYVQEILVYLKYDHLDGAKGIIERYKVFELESDSISFYEALICKREGNIDKAVELLERIIKNGNPDESDMEEFDEVYMELAGIYSKSDKYDEALALYDKVIKLWPEHKHAYGQKGLVLKQQGRYSDAIKLLSKQLEVMPHSYYYINRGILNRFLANYKSALADFSEAIKYEPDNYYCHSRMGLIYEQHRQFEQAIECYDKALSCIYELDDEMKAQIYSYKARTLQCMNRFEESRNVYEEYTERFGLNADVMYDYSELLLRMDKLPEAVAILKKCIDELPYDDDIQMCIRQLCFVYGMEGYIDKANESFMLAISKDKNDKRAYVTMAEVLKDHGIMDEARRLFEKAVRLDNGNKENYYSELIETILSKKSLFKPDVKAYVGLATIKREDMNSPMDYIKMARLYRVIKKAKQAITIADEGLKILRCGGCFYGECYEIWYEKALIYEQLKDYEMAKMCYKKAIGICGHNALFEEKLKRIENK
ncbi:MAG: tetratricopeptide repeat protein [Clostridium sp.]|nr:tetratricopeptide repeat protein [Clostridium sp.]MCM1400010.1 tetratricopeptide repeat protein [Clostridium sp.]MCM1459781.1 tetratricopeptide repeat protein [Bacteroides sp.]